MRYSLATLLLIVFLIASLMAVWFQRKPWYQVREYYTRAFWKEREGQWRAPDGRRMLAQRYNQGKMHQIIREKDTTDALFEFEHYQYALANTARFESDDEVLISTEVYRRQEDEIGPHAIYIFRRRHPEWWWGHLYRPEVWLSAGLFVILVVRIVRHRRRKLIPVSDTGSAR